ncbi:MAG: M23 family metallopeptidase, partial [Clostridiales bacterium]|nr:M23 family metallopeptidase [Clostridiales bacterium]
PIDIATPGDPPDDPADPVDVTDPEDPDDPPEPAEGDDPGDAIAVGKEEEPFILPAGGEWDRAFGYDYDETFADYRFHAGMDMSLPIGELILAVAAGEVLSCGADEQWGGVVLVQCGDVVVGYYGVTPASLSKGAKIAAGDIIGTVGPSPLRELGQKAHLHIEVTLDGEPQNPADYF